jgi:ABC-type transport system involved in multi-copper enzyme maturation permease subunit
MEMSILFALLCSVALAITGKESRKEQIQYAIYTFGSFVAAIFGIGWLMYLGHG